MPVIVRVAVGVLRDHAGRVLIALRPSHKHQGDLWEFPGGKIEAGESSEVALHREIYEELGVAVRRSAPLISVPFSYPDKKVLLEVREILDFDGEPRGNEGQVVRWVSPDELSAYKFPAANVAIVNTIRLPELICITGQYSDTNDLKFRIEQAIAHGAGMVLFRPAEGECQPAEVVRVVANICRQANVHLVLSSILGDDLWQYASGVHLRAEHLTTFKVRPVGATKWLGASCHNLKEVERAKALGVDYVFLSPVLPTESHPGLEGLGWNEFAVIAGQAGVPTYALGGMQLSHLSKAKLTGAKGIAGISCFWK